MRAGLEELACRLLGTPEDERPLRRRGDKIGRDGLRCPLDGGSSLGIDYAPRNDDPSDWIVKAWCRSGQHSDIDAIAAAVGMTTADLRAGNRDLVYKYEPNRYRRPPSESKVEEWRRRLGRSPELVKVMIDRGISKRVLREVCTGHDGERFTFPVYQRVGDVGRILVNVRRYLPGATDEPKWLSLSGSGVHLWPYEIAPGPVLLCEGEGDCLVARSLGINAITNTGGALCWREEWSALLAGRRVFIAYDRDRAGVSGSEMVAKALWRQWSIGGSYDRLIRIVEIPLPFRATRGPDLTDFVKAGGDLKQLIRETDSSTARRTPRPKPRHPSAITSPRPPQNQGNAS